MTDIKTDKSLRLHIPICITIDTVALAMRQGLEYDVS